MRMRRSSRVCGVCAGAAPMRAPPPAPPPPLPPSPTAPSIPLSQHMRPAHSSTKCAAITQRASCSAHSIHSGATAPVITVCPPPAQEMAAAAASASLSHTQCSASDSTLLAPCSSQPLTMLPTTAITSRPAPAATTAAAAASALSIPPSALFALAVPTSSPPALNKGIDVDRTPEVHMRVSSGVDSATAVAVAAVIASCDDQSQTRSHGQDGIVSFYSCAVCSVHCNTATELQKHLTGKPHLKRARQAVAATIKAATLPGATLGADQPCRSASTSLCAVPLSASLASALPTSSQATLNKGPGVDHRREQRDGASEDKENWNVAQQVMLEPSAADSESIVKRQPTPTTEVHKRMSGGVGSATAVCVPAAMIMPCLGDSQSPSGGPVRHASPHSCPLCSVRCNTPRELQKHLTSKPHLKRLRQVAATTGDAATRPDASLDTNGADQLNRPASTSSSTIPLSASLAPALPTSSHATLNKGLDVDHKQEQSGGASDVQENVDPQRLLQPHAEDTWPAKRQSLPSCQHSLSPAHADLLSSPHASPSDSSVPSAASPAVAAVVTALTSLRSSLAPALPASSYAALNKGTDAVPKPEAGGAVRRGSGASAELRLCHRCLHRCPRSEFSSAQLKRGRNACCKTCVANFPTGGYLGTSDAQLARQDQDLLAFGKTHELMDPTLLAKANLVNSILARDTPERALLLKLAERKMRPQPYAAPGRIHDNPWWLPRDYTADELGMDEFD
jgi:hypothetical protein